MPVMSNKTELRKTFPSRLVIIFLFFTAVIIILSYIYYIGQRKKIFTENQNYLTTISELKTRQIEQWYGERLGYAAIIKDNKFLVRSIRQYFTDRGKSVLKDELTKWMESVCREFDYSGVAIIDTLFEPLIDVSQAGSVKTGNIRKQLAEVMETDSIIFTDLHRTGNVSEIHIDILIPLIEPGSMDHRPFGIVILRIDPRKKLYPLIQSWPTPGRTSETLILRKEGDSILFLNELRHRTNSALNLKLPLSAEDILGVKAVNGFTGVSEGVDYRNIPVIGYLNKIACLDWYMVAKVDREELLIPLRRHTFYIVMVTLLLIVTNALIFGYFIWNQRVRSYRNQLKNERAIREAEEKFMYVFDHSLMGMSITKPTGEISVNNAFCIMLGYTSEELSHTRWQDISLPDDIKITEDFIGSILSGRKESARFIKRYLHKNGSVVWADVGTTLRRDENGDPLYFITSVNDITGLKEAEKKISESENRFILAMKASNDGLYDWNLESNDIYYSPGWKKMLGYEDHELPNDFSVWERLTDQEDVKRSWEMQQKLISKQIDRFVLEFRMKHKRGHCVDILSRAEAIFDNNGKAIRIVGTHTDVTQRRKAEEEIHKLNTELEKRVVERTAQLEAANKELEAFSYSVSHDLRAPLRSIHGYTRILLDEYENKLDDEGKRICGIISSGATQMGALIDDLLSFSRVGRSGLNPAIIDMRSLAADVFTEISGERVKERTNIKIGKLHKAFADANLMRLVWDNLISNAIKYSSKKKISEISVSSVVRGDITVYSITDNGVGFDMLYVNKLFGVFQRLHSESEFEGNGVGLANVKRIILRHNGKVWAEGEVDKGATFYFSLPVNEDKSNKTKV